MAKTEFGTWQSVGSPRWLADERTRDHLIPGPAKLDATQFNGADSVVVTASAAALAAATSITVNALSGAIPTGAVLKFGAGEFAELTSAASAGDTALTVEALASGIEAGDVAVYSTGKKRIASGTAVGRTIAERVAKTPYGPAVAADDEIYLLALDVPDAEDVGDGVLLRPNSVVKENYLPEVLAGTMDTGVLTELRARYVCQEGAA